MTDRLIRWALAFGLAVQVALRASGATGGSCAGAAKSLDTVSISERTASVTLVAEYDPEDGTYSEDFGVAYYKIKLVPGKSYVVWLTDNSHPATETSEATTLMLSDYSSQAYVSEDASAPYSSFAEGSCGTMQYLWLGTGVENDNDWEMNPWDTDDTRSEYTFYLLVDNGIPGQTATLHYRQADIYDALPFGIGVKPEVLTVTSDGSVHRDGFAVGDTLTHTFKASLEAGSMYKFSSTPTTNETLVTYMIEPTDGSAPNQYADHAIFDVETGESSVSILAKENCTLLLNVSVISAAGATEKINLTWSKLAVGTVGFATATQTVAEDAGHVAFTLNRQGSSLPVRVKWMTVGETATPGEDYAPTSGVVRWLSGDTASKTIDVPVFADVHPKAEGQETFCVRLEVFPDTEIGMDDELGEGEVVPRLSPSLCRLTISDAGVEPGKAKMTSAEDEPDETPLATGAFAGTLLGGIGNDFTGGVWAVSSVQLTSEASGRQQARLTANGLTLDFTGENGTLTGVCTVAGSVLDCEMRVAFPEGTVADLATRSAWAEVSVSAYVEVGGEAASVDWEGALYRTSSRWATPVLERLAAAVGPYTIGLRVPQPGLGTPAGDGYLMVNVSTDLTVTVKGALPDGTALPEIKTWAADAASGFAIPLSWSDGVRTFGGTLRLQDGGDGLFYADADSELVWRDDRPQFGGDGESGLSEWLMPLGGTFDATANLESLYRGWMLVANDATAPFAGLELLAKGSSWVSDSDVAVDFDRASGLMSGAASGGSFTGVLLTTGCDYSVVGRMTDGLAASAFEMEAAWTDPDWSELRGYQTTASFSLGGGTGTPPSAMTLDVGLKLPLPRYDGLSFSRSGYEFVGWRSNKNNALYAAGELIAVPAEDTVFTAQWTLSVEGFGEALDCADLDLVYRTGETVGWFVQTATTHDGESALQSGNVAKGGSTYVETTVTGPGELSFWWKSSGAVGTDRQYVNLKWVEASDPDAVAFALDGQTVETKTASFDWTQYTAELGAGTHTLRWTFTRKSNNSTEANAARLDELSFGVTYPVVFDPGEGSITSGSATVNRRAGVAVGTFPTVALEGMVCTGWVERATGTLVVETTAVPEGGMTLDALWAPTPVTLTFAGGTGATGSSFERYGYNGDEVALPESTFVRTGYEFCGWKLDGTSDVYQPGERFAVGAEGVSFTAQWTLSVAGFGEALDCADQDLVFRTGETVGWFVQKETTQGGASALQSGNVTQGASTYVETTVTGPGELSFWWKSSGADETARKYVNFKWVEASDPDAVAFALDGKTVQTETASFDWTQYTAELGAGKHTLRWTFTRKSNASTSANAAWLDGLTFAPAQVDYQVSWPTGDGIKSVWTVIDGVTNFVANGVATKVEPGKEVLLDAAADDWMVVDGLGRAIVTAATNITLSVAKVTSADILATSDTSAAIKQALGLTTDSLDGTTEAETVRNLAKVVGWAQANGYSPEQVNGLSFDANGNPTTSLTEAYLLNTTEAGLEAAKAGFAFTSFDPNDPPTADAFAEKGYNGTVKILQAASLSGPWSEEVPTEAKALFYKAMLVK